MNQEYTQHPRGTDQPEPQDQQGPPEQQETTAPQKGVGEAMQPETIQPHEATNALLQVAYEHRYERPELSGKERRMGGYVCDRKPKGFNEACERRARQRTVHRAEFHANVSGKFLDNTVFRGKNVLLEILQNAEPRDSKGTWFGFEFYARGKWRDVTKEIQDFKDEEVEALRIVDNGKGYLPTDMVTLGGGKREDADAAGTFGSGMKMSDRSALGSGTQVVRYSKNWRGVPRLSPVLTDSGWDKTVSYDVEFFNEYGEGSVVEYRNLTQEMLDTARIIGEVYIPLDETLRERLAGKNEYGLILRPKNGKGVVTVSGRHYEFMTPVEKPFLFSYDLHRCKITDQNRHYVDTSAAIENIRKIWGKTNEKALFMELLQNMGTENSKGCHEHEMGGLEKPKEAFYEAIKAFFNIDDLKKVYVRDGKNSEKSRFEKILERRGYQAITVSSSRFITESLASIEIVEAENTLSKITTDLGHRRINLEDYAEENFSSCACKGVCAIDGTEETREIMVIVDGIEIPYGTYLANEKNGNVTELVVRVKGHRVEIQDEDLERTWDDSTSIQGLLKTLDPFFASAAALGVEPYVRNGKFEIAPAPRYGSVYVHATKWGNFPESDLEIHVPVGNLKQAAELKRLHEYSLRLKPGYQPLERTTEGDIVKINGEPKVYEQGIRRTKLDTSGLILSYDSQYALSKDNLADRARAIVSMTNKVEVVEAILLKAQEAPDEKEFAEYKATPENKEVWRLAFEKVFGKKTVINNLAGTHHEDSTTELQEASNINSVDLHPILTQTMVYCEVPKLSDAVQADKVQVVEPKPYNAVLLKLADVVDEAISIALPRKFGMIQSDILVAESMRNCFGDKLEFGDAYMNPFLADTAAYVHKSIMHRGKLARLFKAIYTKRIEVYKSILTPQEFADFSTRVVIIVAHYTLELGFMNELSGLFATTQDREEIIDRTARRVHLGAPNEDGEFPELQDDPEQFKELRKRKKKEAKAKTKAEKREKKRLVDKAARQEKSHGRTANIAKIATAISLAVAATCYVGSDSMEETRAKILAMFKAVGEQAGQGVLMIREKIEDILPDSSGFQRTSAQYFSGVDVDEENSDTCQGGECRMMQDVELRPLRKFFSAPELFWGRFMRESLLTEFNGKQWMSNYKAPEFENTKFPNGERIAHYQTVGENDTEISIRTMAGGYIDEDSIALIGENGPENMEFVLVPKNRGEFVIKLQPDEHIKAVAYQTLMPNPEYWEEIAEQLTDQDFEALNEAAYKFYTRVPLTEDSSNIKFNFAAYPDTKNLQGFIEEIKKLPPFKRVQAIKRLVETELHYSRSKRTAIAHKKFHAGMTPEKDYITFAFNSKELRNSGDSDCDGQNTIFAMLCRMAGIPTRLTFVRYNGAGHGPAEVFLPKIGWVLMDTMGERDVEESMLAEAARIVEELENGAPVQSEEDYYASPTRKDNADRRRQIEAERDRANKRIQDLIEFNRRGCSNLQRRF